MFGNQILILIAVALADSIINVKLWLMLLI